jgi:small nuclear ribonucleoprotein (snRNP)-like protein
LQSVDSFVSAILDDASELGDTPEQSDNDIENVGLLYSHVAWRLLTAL